MKLLISGNFSQNPHLSSSLVKFRVLTTIPKIVMSKKMEIKLNDGCAIFHLPFARLWP